MELTTNDITLIKTCGACPEQYDAFIGDKQVGYLRLRHGTFRVKYPNVRGKLVYEACPDGDGIFEDYERDQYLEIAKRALLEEYNAQAIPPSHALACPTCSKIIDMRDLGQVLCHGFMNKETGKYERMSDEEIAALDVQYSSSKKVGDSVEWTKGKKRIDLN